MDFIVYYDAETRCFPNINKVFLLSKLSNVILIPKLSQAELSPNEVVCCSGRMKAVTMKAEGKNKDSQGSRKQQCQFWSWKKSQTSSL